MESGEKNRDSNRESRCFTFSLLSSFASFLPFSSFSIFFLSFVQSPSPLPTKRTPRREFLKVETFALAGAQLLKLSITGPPSPSLSISSFSPLSTRGRHRYKTAFASLSNSRSYSPFSLPLSSPSYILRHLSPSFVSTPHAYVYTSSSIVIQFTEVESPPARRVD